MTAETPDTSAPPGGPTDARAHDNLRGALWILTAASGAAGLALSVRALAGDVATIQIVFVRCALGLAIVLPMVWRTGIGFSVVTRRWPLQLLRALLSLVALYCGFYVLSQIPVATATVLFFTAPLFVTILSVPFFGERVGWRRAMATLAGFAGTVVVVQPSPAGVDPAMLVGLGSSLVFACVLLLGKKLSATEPAESMMLYTGVIAGLASLPFAAAEWVAPTWGEWLLLLAVTLFGTLRNYADIRGYAIGEASVMAPFQYTRIVIVAVAGYFLFAELPGVHTAAGAAIIIASTLYIARREARLAREGRLRTRGGVAAP